MLATNFFKRLPLLRSTSVGCRNFSAASQAAIKEAASVEDVLSVLKTQVDEKRRLDGSAVLQMANLLENEEEVDLIYDALKEFRLQWREVHPETPTRFVARLLELGYLEKAIEYLKVNPTYRVFPTRATYRALLNHCKRAGLGDEGYEVWKIWTSLDDLQPKASDYYTVIRTLLRTGDYQKAEEIWDTIQNHSTLRPSKSTYVMILKHFANESAPADQADSIKGWVQRISEMDSSVSSLASEALSSLDNPTPVEAAAPEAADAPEEPAAQEDAEKSSE